MLQVHVEKEVTKSKHKQNLCFDGLTRNNLLYFIMESIHEGKNNKPRIIFIVPCPESYRMCSCLKAKRVIRFDVCLRDNTALAF